MIWVNLLTIFHPAIITKSRHSHAVDLFFLGKPLLQ